MDFSIVGLWNQMSWVPRGVVLILLVMSVLAIGISVERLVTFRRSRRQSIRYIGALQPLVATPGRLRDARGLEQGFRGSPVGRVIGGGVAEFVGGLQELAELSATEPADLELVVDGAARAMDRIKERELANLRRGLSVLATISSSAPFVGLFGTVFGIISAFRKMADPSGGTGLAAVSGGIAEALLTTAVGLAVAIGSVWFYNAFTSAVDDLTVDLDETAGEVLDGMAREGRRRGQRPAA